MIELSAGQVELAPTKDQKRYAEFVLRTPETNSQGIRKVRQPFGSSRETGSIGFDSAEAFLEDTHDLISHRARSNSRVRTIGQRLQAVLFLHENARARDSLGVAKLWESKTSEVEEVATEFSGLINDVFTAGEVILPAARAAIHKGEAENTRRVQNALLEYGRTVSWIMLILPGIEENTDLGDRLANLRLHMDTNFPHVEEAKFHEYLGVLAQAKELIRHEKGKLVSNRGEHQDTKS
jgi:hypothetical protein